MDLNLTHETYTKINTLYKRDEKGNIVIGDFSLPEFKYLYNNKWLAFEKIDGTNMSFYWDGHEMQIHGKSENSSIPSMLMDTMKNILTEEKLAEVFSIKYDENGNEILRQFYDVDDQLTTGYGKYAIFEKHNRVIVRTDVF